MKFSYGKLYKLAVVTSKKRLFSAKEDEKIRVISFIEMKRMKSIGDYT